MFINNSIRQRAAHTKAPLATTRCHRLETYSSACILFPLISSTFCVICNTSMLHKYACVCMCVRCAYQHERSLVFIIANKLGWQSAHIIPLRLPTSAWQLSCRSAVLSLSHHHQHTTTYIICMLPAGDCLLLLALLFAC